jgi:hypothetical protein
MLNPDHEQVIYLRLPQSLKEEIKKAAETDGLSINSWVVNVLRLRLRERQGFPPPPPAQRALPTPAEALHSYLTDEPLVTPCGRSGACPGTTDSPEVLHGVHWCRECGIRIG